MAPYEQYRLVSQPEGPELALSHRCQVYLNTVRMRGEPDSLCKDVC